jgi:hypothetical protein
MSVHLLLLLFLLLLFLLLLVIFMRGVHNYVPQTNHVTTVCSVAAVLQLHFMLHVMLFPMLNVLYLYISTLRSQCAVPNMAVFCNVTI